MYCTEFSILTSKLAKNRCLQGIFSVADKAMGHMISSIFSQSQYRYAGSILSNSLNYNYVGGWNLKRP